MANTEEPTVGFGMTRIRYRKMFWLLFKIESVEGDQMEDYTPSWAVRLFGPYLLQVRRMPTGTFDKITPIE